jgi:hypothetical protein
MEASLFLCYRSGYPLVVFSHNWHQEVCFAQGVVHGWNLYDGTPVINRSRDA